MDYMTSACFLVLSVLLSSLAGGGNAEKAQALFVFGDSYADTGNHSPYNHTLNELWRRPYGFTWPGYPSGRFSSGKIQTDFWAELLGLPTPIAYELLRTHKCDDIQKKIKQGLNFAVGGSGIFADYGFITVNTQLVQFKELIADSRAFNAHEFARSVTLISVAGNDYLWFLDYKIGSIKELEGLVEPVVNGIVRVVKDFYGFGLRNFVVIDCRIVVDPRTRESRGFGFVTMDTLEDAERCLKYLNRSTLEGRIITVEKRLDLQKIATLPCSMKLLKFSVCISS